MHVTGKAVQAARELHASDEKSKYDPNLLDVLWESEAIKISARHGVISVKIYTYNDSSARIGVYRVGVNSRTGAAYQIKELCPLDDQQADALARELVSAACELRKINRKVKRSKK